MFKSEAQWEKRIYQIFSTSGEKPPSYKTTSKNTSSGPATQKIIPGTCASCGEQDIYSDLEQLPCKHEYCHKCLSKLSLAAIMDKSPYAPSCCGKVIPLATVRLCLTPELLQEVLTKSVAQPEMKPAIENSADDLKEAVGEMPPSICAPPATSAMVITEQFTARDMTRHEEVLTKSSASQETRPVTRNGADDLKELDDIDWEHDDIVWDLRY